ncbi:MAG TPA: hypothetical protein VLA39_02285 [Marinobacterium sp.]|nr:hypothetical protein [Marinobacterium sp.]
MYKEMRRSSDISSQLLADYLRMIMTSTSKTCANCGSTALVRLTSMDALLCADCQSYTAWKLKPTQASMLIEGRRGEEELPENLSCLPLRRDD